MPAYQDRPFLTVMEAADTLGISRTLAYEMARRYLATDGREGLPVVKLDKRLMRVPRREFEARFRCGAATPTWGPARSRP